MVERYLSTFVSKILGHLSLIWQEIETAVCSFSPWRLGTGMKPLDIDRDTCFGDSGIRGFGDSGIRGFGDSVDSVDSVDSDGLSDSS